MFGVDNQKFSDMEVAQAYGERMKDRMAWCRKEASEYLEKNERRRFYKLSYTVDPGEKVAYVAISDGVLQEVEEALKKEFAENGPFNNDDEKYEFYSEVITDILCDYVPERDQHWAGGSPIVTDFDRNEFIYCTNFKVMHTDFLKEDPDEFVYDVCNIELSNEEYIDLVVARLFDPHLTFYDLKYLYEDIYHRVDDLCQLPHHHHIIFMQEINETAQAILDSKSKDELPKPIGGDNPFMPVIWNIIFKNADQFDDPQLMKALKIAVTN